LASNLPGVRSVVEEGRNGFTFRVKDRADLAEKLALLVNNTELQVRMAFEAREIAISRYNQDLIWTEVERTMKSAFNTRTVSGEKSRP
jgi:glycosyltransferase involved in cell wall biosynthesis